MSYYPPRDPYGRPPHGAGPYEHPDDRAYRAERRRDDGVQTIANIIRVVTGLIATVFGLHILFVVFSANRGNEFVAFIRMLARTLVLGLGDVFTPGNAVLGVILNYGLAMLVYALIAHFIIRALRRH
jgi:hypothetical protein